MSWQERITVNPSVRSGKPCIKGTRITVYDILEYLAGGMSEDKAKVKTRLIPPTEMSYSAKRSKGWQSAANRVWSAC